MSRYFVFAILFSIHVNAATAQTIFETIVQKGSGGKCQALSVSPDGLLLAKINAGHLSEIEIWNTKTGNLLRVININIGKNYLLNAAKQVRFWQGSKYIITGTLNGDHEVYNVVTGLFVKRIPLKSYIDGVFAVCEKKGYFAALHPLSFAKNQLQFLDLYSGIIYDSVELNFGGITAMDFSPEGDKIVLGTENGSFHIIELSGYNRILKADSMHKNAVTYLQWTNDDYILSSDESGYAVIYLKTNKLILNGSLEPNAKIVTSPTEDCYYEAQPTYMVKRTGSHIIQKKFGIETDSIHRIDFDQKNKQLYVLTDNFIRVWDMNNILQTESKSLKSFIPDFDETRKTAPGNLFQFIPARRSCIYSKSNQLIELSIDTTASPVYYNLPNVNSLFVSPTGLIAATTNKKLTFWDAGVQNEFTIEGKDSILFKSLVSGKTICIGSKDSVIKIYDPIQKSTQKIRFSGEISCGKLSTNDNSFAVAGDNLYLYDLVTQKSRQLYEPDKEDDIYQYEGPAIHFKRPQGYKQVCFSIDNTKLYTLNFLGQLKIWDLKNFTIDTILSLNATQLLITGESKNIMLVIDNQIALLNTTTYKTEARFVFLASGDYIVSLHDNYYKASKKGARAVAFRKGVQTYSFDQFDFFYNRPDRVVEKIGNAEKSMVESLERSVAKRQQKLGYIQQMPDISELEVPEISIQDYKSLLTSTKENKIEFRISAKDKKYSLVNLNAFVNGVPFWSKQGYNLISEGDTTQRKSINITLTAFLDPGKNLIEVNCTNEKGIESTKESFEIFYEVSQEPKKSLYFIGVAAGKYKNPDYNLHYPEKDINDMSKLFLTKNSLYDTVYTILLTNEQVTKEAIVNLKKTLQKTNIYDQVILHWSGHGLLTQDLDYLLATYDMDFANPLLRGLPYNDLENLLDDIPARNRILFIDACHSGEIDKDEIVVTNTMTNRSKIDTTKGVELEISGKNSFDLINELFTDTRRNAGANIISAAGGTEYALESDKWLNGVFTFVLLNGIRDKKADRNKDNEITISELQQYLQDTVPILTGGRQKPTSRTENLIKNIRIW